jgi:hypothetical protein
MRQWSMRFWVVVLVAMTVGLAQAGTREDAAIEAADSWLALVDAGDYEASWRASSKLMRDAVSAADWAATAGAVRRPLGKLISREVRSATLTNTLPGAPDGEYVVIQYDAVFENKQAAVETVTPMQEDGAWRVSGYYIR